MGYETTFLISADIPTDNLIDALEEVCGYDFYALNSDTISVTGKWYEHEKDIAKVSKKFPGTLFTVKGYGEDKEDIWVLYALNGNLQRENAEIVFPPCKFTLPKKEYRTVNVTIAGVDVPVEIECYEGTTDDDVYTMARNKLKSLL